MISFKFKIIIKLFVFIIENIYYVFDLILGYIKKSKIKEKKLYFKEIVSQKNLVIFKCNSQFNNIIFKNYIDRKK